MKLKDKKEGFTIVELLVVMSIIIILLGILLPSLAAVRRFAKDVTQRSQMHDITNALEMFRVDFGDEYPSSSRFDVDSAPYCGAMKLCEALVGKDKLGFHIDSRFTNVTGIMSNGEPYYYETPPPSPPPGPVLENLAKRKAPYMNPDAVQIATMGELYTNPTTTGFDANSCVVLCDVYSRQRITKKLGMPILYYKADVTKIMHDTTVSITDCCDVVDYIYNFCDNDDLTALGSPPSGTTAHPINTNPMEFYLSIKNKEATIMEKPYNEGFYILLSAGHDGLYGTRDDIYNFSQ